MPMPVPMKDCANAANKDNQQQVKFSSVVYKTTFSSQAKDVRRKEVSNRENRPPVTVDKENLPRGFEIPSGQVLHLVFQHEIRTFLLLSLQFGGNSQGSLGLVPSARSPLMS